MKITQLMFRLLKENISLRDNDVKLVMRTWIYLLEHRLHLAPEIISALDMLKLIYDGELPSFKDILTCKKRLQRIHPDLRGTKENKHAKEDIYIDMVMQSGEA